jgi:2-polyprenyl-3-methyl-5-hydroxy-6-metoxy-1,4-benzoquinol methylase
MQDDFAKKKYEIRKLLDNNRERNLYVHGNPLVRDIFWQRIRFAVDIADDTCHCGTALDIGGGNSVLAHFVAHKFKKYYIVDQDAQEAVEITARFNYKNVVIYEKKIQDLMFDEKFEVIFATDVLEHFKDLCVPLEFITRHLAKNGKLVITLPTENIFYRAGRIVIRKNKPEDHYHNARTVLRFLVSNGFKIIHHEYLPRYIGRFPLFSGAVLTFSDSFRTVLYGY